jgi:hypothetical protein
MCSGLRPQKDAKRKAESCLELSRSEPKTALGLSKSSSGDPVDDVAAIQVRPSENIEGIPRISKP